MKTPPSKDAYSARSLACMLRVALMAGDPSKSASSASLHVKLGFTSLVSGKI